MASGNPTLRTSTFANFQSDVRSAAEAERKVMTVEGAISKTAILLVIVAAGFAFAWTMAMQMPALMSPMMWGGALGSLGVVLLTVWKKKWSAVTGPIYAVLEGVFLGAISFVYNAQFPGLPVMAVVATFAVMGVMLALYKTGVIKVTERFKSILSVAILGVMATYLIQIGLSFFFSASIPGIFENGLIGIGFSLLVCGIAAFTLVNDFHNISEGAKHRVPKYMEWYCAFGLVVSLAWLYLELLRLFAKLQSRD